MVSIKKFKAIRPQPKYAKDVAALPYDVMNTKEAYAMAQGNPYSFLHITRSEIDLDDNIDPYSPIVYEKAKDNLNKFLNDGVLFQDENEKFYVYRLIMNGRSQIGLVALSSVAEYKNGTIKIHEKTRAAKVTDRTQHILTTKAQTGPVFLTFRDNLNICELLIKESEAEPLYDFTANDGIQHTIWEVKQPEIIESAFAKIPNTYIADGHHRANSSANCYDILSKDDNSNGDVKPYSYFLSVVFPDNQLEIMAYNRIIKSCNLSCNEVLNKLKEVVDIEESGRATPSKKREVSFYMDKKWYSITWKPTYQIPNDPVDALDVSILYELILKPIFNIGDLRTDNNIDFIGGIRGTMELERLVDSNEAFCAFSMYPVTIADLLTIADQGKTMAPKSTWFEPKLRSGLLVHKI